jgi:hypothetical protein
MANEHRTEEPHDRLTRLCQRVLELLEAEPEYDGERCVIFISGEGNGGLMMHGYENDSEAVADVLIHLKAIMAANGRQMIIAPIKGRG